MLVITLFYSCFTILGVGTFLYPIMKRCGVMTEDIERKKLEVERSEIENELIEKVE